ncbi:MAG: hypothetical protein WC254_06365 [Candidatus Woesearchaeota archaeon]|jgi:hypothetical protein
MKKLSNLFFISLLFILGITLIPSHKVDAAITVNVFAKPSTINKGGSSTITWSSSGATSCTYNGSSVALSSSTGFVVYPTSTTTYTIECTAPDPVVGNHISYQNLVSYGFYLPGHPNGIDYGLCLDLPAEKNESFDISYTLESPRDYPITGNVTAYISKGQTCSPYAFYETGPQDSSGMYYSSTNYCVTPSNSDITVDSSISCN